jgi:hypothetical protein
MSREEAIKPTDKLSDKIRKHTTLKEKTIRERMLK